jgi:transposase
MYTQPDFANVKSNLESLCHTQGVDVIFLPKYHCELNFIEQCWGYAKRLYRMKDRSSSEADLERNVIESLNAVPKLSMRR